MSIDIRDGRYFVAFWTFSGESFDYLATVYRDGDGLWHMVSRLRGYEDDKVFDSKDKKTWAGFVLPPSSEETVEALMDRVIAQLMNDFRGRRLQKHPCHTDRMTEVADVLARSSIFHLRHEG